MTRLILICAFALWANSCPAGIITVDDDGPADFNNIQAAINDANNGDVVIVQPGTYTGDGNRDIDFLGKAITVRSTQPNDPNIVAATIIDCNGSEEDPHRGFRFHNQEDANSILDGLTITNGFAPWHWYAGPLPGGPFKDGTPGGAVACSDAGPTIRNCLIMNNTTLSSGGGIYGSRGPIMNCVIATNYAHSIIPKGLLALSTIGGGGLAACNGSISNCIIAGNVAMAPPSYSFGSGGGGLAGCNGPISDCTITDNWASFGGGLRACNGPIAGCTISGNLAKRVGGGLANCNGNISNCYIADNCALEQQTGIPFFGGGGLFECTGQISDCSIIHNSTGGYGGGLASCTGQINNCLISKNSAGSRGGGASNCAYFANCKINANRAQEDGGALYECLSITNCQIAGNKAERGGAVYCWQDSPIIINSTITGNWAECGGAIMCCGDTYPRIVNSILWANTAASGPEIALRVCDCPPWTICGPGPATLPPPELTVSYSDIEGGYDEVLVDPNCVLTWGPGNIDADPCFVEPGHWADVNDANIIVEPNDPNSVWLDGDYHLRPGSPCIDSGDNNSLPADTTDLDGDGNTVEPIPWDLEGNPRIIDGDNDSNSVVDMGTYEFWPPLEVPMRFTPQALNPGSEGNWFKLHFVLPHGYDVNDVDFNVPARCKLMDTGEMIESDYLNAFVNEEGLVEVEAGFDRGDFSLCLSQPAERIVTVMGLLAGTSGQDFYGTDTVKIINKTLQQIAAFASYWLAEGCDSPDWCGGVDLDQNGTVDFADFALFDGCCVEIPTP